MFIYVTFDSNGFVTDYKKVETEGYTKVFVLDSWINQFAQYPDKFRYDSTNQTLLNPGNLPDISLKQVSADVSTLQTQLQSLQSTATEYTTLSAINFHTCFPPSSSLYTELLLLPA